LLALLSGITIDVGRRRGGTRGPRVPAAAEKMIDSSDAQAPPRLPPAQFVQMVTGGPPRTDTFLRSASWKYPIHSPSGEKNGARALKVPASGIESSRLSDRTYSCDCPAPPVYAR
jgi:hypothetical protein